MDAVIQILELDVLARLLLSLVLGAVIGLEREWSGKPAGLRTNILICVGAALLTEISVFVASHVAPHEYIRADPARIAQVVRNLLDNAVKYCKQKPEITLKTREWEDCINVIMEDNGPGIEKKYQKKIFDKFFRVPTGNVHDVKGFGIGLNYVKNMIRAHKWKIKLESTPGEGSSFIITIPKHNSQHGG